MDVVAAFGGVKRDRHAPRSGQSVSIERQRALRTMALSLAKLSSSGVEVGTVGRQEAQRRAGRFQ